MKYLSERAMAYIDSIWDLSNSSEVDDITLFWEKDMPEMSAKRLVDAGAVEPNCKLAREIIAVAKSIDLEAEMILIDEALDGVTVLRCNECNYVHFINGSWLDPNDWISGGCAGCGRKHTCEVYT